MSRIFILTATMIVPLALPASAQKPSRPATVARTCSTWDLKTMIGPNDSVVATPVLTVSADGKRSLKLPDRDSLPVRVLAAGGDSIVMKMGPYESVLRPGQMATTQTTAHYVGDTMMGTLETRYANGDTLRGRIVGICRNKVKR